MADNFLSSCEGSEKSNPLYGDPGDQTSYEYRMREWYVSGTGWTVVLRHPDQKIAACISAFAVQAAQNENIGYSQDVSDTQNSRLSFWWELQKVGYIPANIKTPCNSDCSASTSTIVKAVGYYLQDSRLMAISPGLVCSNMRSPFVAAGFTAYTDSAHLDSSANLVRGDVLINESRHAAIWTDGIAYADPSALNAAAASGSFGGSLYDCRNTRDDALIREFGYADFNYEPSINPSGFRMSVVNYTTMAAGIWSAFCNKFGVTTTGSSSSGSTGSATADTSDFSGNWKIAADFFLKKGLNSAAAAGIMGNIYRECSFRTDTTGDAQYGGGGGICGWLNQWSIDFLFFNYMQAYVKTNFNLDWKETMSGQLEFLWYTLTGGTYTNGSGTHQYSFYDSAAGTSLLNVLKSVPNTEAGARKAADRFVRIYEVPAGVNDESIRRGGYAADYFKKMNNIS